MERKIGEIFEYKGEWYQCVKDKLQESCVNCCFYNGGHKKCDDETVGNCLANSRSDGYSVCFKKLEKVGEPYMLEDKKFQKYRVFHAPYIYNKIHYSWQSFADPYYISLEIKQKKEDMSNTETLWYGPDKKEAKNLELSNLKPFSLEAAKSGKPVCTRDGRKARIICFDVKAKKPIAALITNDDTEEVHFYYDNGRSNQYQKYRYDLMMLPEKKEGWVNVYKDSVYDTKDQALIGRSIRGYIDTIKISWEE